jgi:hypothetical protein
MKTRKIILRHSILFISFIITAFIAPPGFSAQDDTVKINDVATPPLIDGTGDDDCWKNAEWQTIDQVWINYGEVIESSDFNGRYKAVWSSKENLLYFLVEVSDDVLVGGFISGQTADVYNYDIAEVFLDENKSGGPHINDNSQTGENAENAFAYHIYADFPEEGEVNKECWVGDIPGPHTDHIAEFAMQVKSGLCTREFSIKVYGETYDDANPEASRVKLTKGKIMGLSLAYCDNDEDDGQRDNFFGSVWVTEENNNSHWMNADDFGAAILFSDLISGNIECHVYLPLMEIYPNPALDYLSIKIDDAVNKMEIFDIGGKVVSGYRMQGQKSLEIPISLLNRGFYYIKIIYGNDIAAFGKFLKL